MTERLTDQLTSPRDAATVVQPTAPPRAPQGEPQSASSGAPRGEPQSASSGAPRGEPQSASSGAPQGGPRSASSGAPQGEPGVSSGSASQGGAAGAPKGTARDAAKGTALGLAPSAAAREQLTITDPRDGSVVGTVEVASNEDVARAAAAARHAFAGWAATPPAERGKALRRAAGMLAAGAEQLAHLNTRETGKPFAEALGGVEAGVDTLLQYSELAPVHRGRSLNGPRTAVDYTVAEPRGVAAVVTPWNDPVAVACGLIGAALATGNTVVQKPSERCPQVGLLLGELLAGAFPPGVLETVSGDAPVGERLLAQPEVSVALHVGSSEAGARIARAAALTGIHVVRENGGNDALIVDAGVDPKWAAAQAALGAFANAGQICTSVERIFVHRDIAGAFIESLVAEARALNGSGRLAPLVDDRMRSEVAAQVDESVELGARIAEGGRITEGAGSFYPATVLVSCEPFMPVMSRETFGPVAPVRVVESFDEALRLAADDHYGLAATVLTASIENAHRAAAELPVGTVKVNAVFGGAPGGSAQPRSASGAGFGYGPELLDELTLVKVVHLGLPVLPAPPAPTDAQPVPSVPPATPDALAETPSAAPVPPATPSAPPAAPELPEPDGTGSR